MVESGGLENRYSLRAIGGSNPSLSALMYFVYILYSIGGKRTYVGQTEARDRRISEHNVGKVRSTRGYRPWKLVYSEECKNREEALKLEKWFKSAAGRKRIARILRDLKINC